MEFVESIEREGKRVIYKHASAIAAFGMPTRIVDRAARARFDSLKYAPALFQEEFRREKQLAVKIWKECYCSFKGGPGFEPRLSESESAVLPLNYPPPAPILLAAGVPRENLPEVRQASREAIAAFVADYNHLRYHESISNLMGIDMSGRRPLIKGYFAALRLIVGAVMSSAGIVTPLWACGSAGGSLAKG